LECLNADSGVGKAFSIAKEAWKPMAVLKLPMPLLNMANAPLAVFWKPVVLNKSAPVPVAVFSSAVFNASVPAPMPVIEVAGCKIPERQATYRCIEPPAGEVKKSVLSFGCVPARIPSIRWRHHCQRFW
jgi:hypothetical protein